MNDASTTKDFLLLFRNPQAQSSLSEDEMHEAMRRLIEWIDRWTERGAIKAAQPLGSEGKVISGSRQRTIADGPYSEAKEAVAGYVVVSVADLDEAMAIAGEWPMLDYDCVLEVRPMVEECPKMAQVRAEMAAAVA